MADESALTQLVVIGASAGGIDALSQLVATLPDNFPAPVVIAQHLDPNRASHLAEILSKRGPLPVRTVLDHEQLTAGTMYVIPADRHVSISDGYLSLSMDGTGRPKPSIDLLFSSAAGIYGDRLIGVILTGLGSDGAAGGLDVKKAGGTVIIQNPATAQYASMPRSLPPSAVDFVANIAEIGPLLRDLVMGAQLLGGANETKTLQTFLRQLHDLSGLDFTAYKRPTILRRLKRRMVATGSPTIAAYMRFVQQHPEEYGRLISAFLIKVTEFFRDRDLFTALREQILPELIAHARLTGNELRIWSAGCATGEEAYSLAILIAEILGYELENSTVRIFATDLDSDAIAFARRGVYPASLLAGMPADLISRYFHKFEGEYEAHKRIRNLVIFGVHDLGQRAPFPRIDLVLCRNVLIYFTVELQKRVLQLFAYALRDGGQLVLGKAETISPAAEFFMPVQAALKVYRRYGDRLLMPLGQIGVTPSLRPAAVPLLHGASGDVQALHELDMSRQRTSLEKLGALVFNLPIGVVVVDRHYDVQIINNLAHILLGIHRPSIGEDVLHLADSVPTKPFRAIIDAALRGEEPPAIGQVLQVEGETGEQRFLQIVGYPQKFDGAKGPISSVLVLVTDVTASHDERQRAVSTPNAAPKAPDVATNPEQDLQSLTAQVQRLMTINRELREANQELAAANVELHQTNEEYLVNSEEVQAAAEEVETLNEELQATNEELETLNEELQATVEELNATNDDLEARTLELQDLAHTREAEQVTDRAQLTVLLERLRDAALIIDSAGQPLRVNPTYLRLFGEPQRAINFVDDQGRPLAADATPMQRAARGETFTSAIRVTD